MKSEALSQIELILPSAVVEACYKLKRTAGSKFRALDKTAGTSSDIVLFKQSDDSVCINISVTRIRADNSNSEDTTELFDKFDTNHIKSTSSPRRGSRTGRGALKNGCTKHRPAVLPAPTVPIERGRTARRARGKWRGGHRQFHERKDDCTVEQEFPSHDTENSPNNEQESESSSSSKEQQAGTNSSINETENCHTTQEEEPEGKSDHKEKEKMTEASSDNAHKDKASEKTSKAKLRASAVPKSVKKRGKTGPPQKTSKPKKILTKPAALRNCRNAKLIKPKGTDSQKGKKVTKGSSTNRKGNNDKDEPANELPDSDTPKKAKKSSDRLANIWGHKRRRISKKTKVNNEESHANGDSEEVKLTEVSKDLDCNKELESVRDPPQDDAQLDVSVPTSAIIKETAPQIDVLTDGHVDDTSFTQTVISNDAAQNHLSEIREDRHLQPSFTYQPQNIHGNDLYNSVSSDQSILETSLGPNPQITHDFLRNHSHYTEMNEYFPAQQPGFTKNTYEHMSLETNFESNVQPGYENNASGDEIQHITLTNVSDHFMEDSRSNHIDDHLKLPQKKRPIARQMISVEEPMSEWDGEHHAVQSNMLESQDPAAQAELEMSVHTLQSVMASQGQSESSMDLSADNAEKTQNGSGQVNPSNGSQKKNYKREYLIQCKICHVKVKDYAYLFRHIGKLHRNIPDHKAYMEEIRPLMRTPCHICGITVSSISNMASHMRQKHSDSTDMVTCPTCNKVYKTANSLKQHMRICHAEDDKRYVCEICQAKFAERRGLDEHVNCSHVTTKVFNCEVCGKTFLTKGRLRRHLLIHGEFRYKCHYCNKGFHLKDNMNKHVEIMHEKNLGKRFECQYCNKKFAVKGNMMQHVMGVHLKKYQYSCSVCNTGFRRKGDLLKHVEQKHPENTAQTIIDLSGSDSRDASFDMPMAEEIPNPSSPLIISPNPHPDEIIHTQVLTPAML